MGVIIIEKVLNLIKIIKFVVENVVVQIRMYIIVREDLCLVISIDIGQLVIEFLVDLKLFFGFYW